ncbi:MAG: integrase arm-type DNA-binding domain-containing protein [Rhizobacter sp.]
MATNTLSDARIRSLKPSDKSQKFFDGGGLHLVVTAKGARVWRVAYRVAGKPQTASLGPYPAVTLAEARAKRDAIHAQLRDGADPRESKAKKPRAAVTLREARITYWAGRNDVSAGYRSNAERAIELHIEPLLGDRDIGGISRDDLLDALKRMDAAGLYVYVRKTRMWLGLVWDWAVEHGHAAVNVPALIKPEKAFGKASVKHFAALELTEIPDFMARLAMESRIQSVLGCLLLAYTWVRTTELRMMKWTEIDGDLWRIPKERMKMKRDHLVPLSPQALALLDELKARSRGSEYVFPSDRRLDRPMSENSILYLLHRMGYKGRMTGHGFRSVASTWANEAGHASDAIERQLAHVPSDDVRAAYNRAEFMPARRVMLQAWADWLGAALSRP